MTQRILATTGIVIAALVVVSAGGLANPAAKTFEVSLADIDTIAVDPNSGKGNEFSVDHGDNVTLAVTNDDSTGTLHNLWFADDPYKAHHTKNLQGNESETLTFTASKAGTFGFLCNLHPATMVGKMTVKAKDGTNTTADGKKTPGFEVVALVGAAGVTLMALRRRD